MVERMKVLSISTTTAMIIEVIKKTSQSQIQVVCFEVQATCSTSPPLPREGFHYPPRITTKAPQLQGLHKTEYTTLTFNPLHKR